MSAPVFADHTPPEPPADALALVDAPDGAVYPPPAKPMEVARHLVNDVFATDGHPTLTYWQGDWWRWADTHWQSADELEVKGPIYRRLERVVHIKDGEDHEWTPTTSRVGNLMEPLQILTRAPNNMSSPGWLTEGHTTPAGGFIPLDNGLLDRATYQMHPHTPELFNTHCLPFSYDPDAQCPTWLGFLEEVFAHDPAGADLLQEYTGYLIDGGTDLHKGLMILGPPRAGKGVITRTQQKLMGEDNTVAPTLQSLQSEFGLERWIGKPLAIIADARMGGRSNETVVERLLNVIGGDPVLINRKNRPHWSGTLPSRVVLCSNEIPRFMDASGAITNRWVGIQLERSFLGKEDTTLETRLEAELPGIFNWALAGLERLEQQRKFTQPATMQALLEDMGDIASPVHTFLEDEYEVTGHRDDFLTLKVVHSDYRNWCEDGGLSPCAQLELGRRINAVGGAVSVKNTIPEGERKKNRFVFGIKTKSKF